MKLLFVGEERSNLAIQRNLTWESGRLAAKQLFDALIPLGIDPKKCKFTNWFEKPGPNIVKNHKGHVIGMGQKVQKALEKEGIEHIKLIHPAARGKIRKKERYLRHVREQLGALA